MELTTKVMFKRLLVMIKKFNRCRLLKQIFKERMVERNKEIFTRMIFFRD